MIPTTTISGSTFVVAFEGDSASEFLDLVQEFRETEPSRYTLRDTPMYTCRRSTIEEIVDSLAWLRRPDSFCH